ncbi:MAG: succinate dehydrogenase/fumarate reductase iron-sulfur subunit [Deltaproteobacteria bacterium]|nr:succinate dehydrogenase/fumarate reductase iron-sulfur subunit [Deltaproteobacteria bacterium]
MKERYALTLNISRYDPATRKSWVQEYRIEAGRILRFTDVFRKINKELDPTFAWNSSCEHAQCGSCSVVINGKPMLACELLVENSVEQFKTETFTIGPITVAPVLRDLIVDLEKAYDRVHSIQPFIIKPSKNPHQGEEYRISPRVMEKYLEATRCVNCFCCATACISSQKGFIGPNAVLASLVRIMDPREDATEERLKLLYSGEGVYRCHTSMACSSVCPKKIDVAHFIGMVKEGLFS